MAADLHHPLSGSRPRQPLYQQMVDALRQRINRGDLKPGAPAVSESELIAEYRVSSTTARRCLDELARQGLVRRVQGKGTFVTDQAALNATRQIGVLYHDLLNLTDSFATNALRGVNEALSEGPFEPALLQFGNIVNSQDPGDALLTLVRRHQLQALLLMSPLPLPWLEPVLASGMPVAAANFTYGDSRIDCVVSNSGPAVQRLAQRIAEQGHKQVAVLRGMFPQTLVEGVGLSTAEMPALKGVQWTVHPYRYFHPGDVSRLVTEQLASKSHPTAYLCYGYEAALEAAGVIRSLGWSIPQDISVAFLGVPSGPTQFAGELVPISEIVAQSIQSLVARLTGTEHHTRVEKIDTSTLEGLTLGPAPLRRPESSR